MAYFLASIDVVEIVVADRRAVREGRQIGRRASRRAQHRGAVGLAAGVGQRDAAGDADRLFTERGDAAAERIGEMSSNRFDRAIVEVIVTQRCRIGRELLRDVARVRCLRQRGMDPAGACRQRTE